LCEIVEGPIVWARGVRGAVVLRLRAGDFIFDSRQEVLIEHQSHDAEVVRLHPEESLSFHVARPEAAIG
jgi:uncharacterized linocin/CFP29 family protein